MKRFHIHVISLIKVCNRSPYLRACFLILFFLSSLYFLFLRASHLKLIQTTSRYKINKNPYFTNTGNHEFLISPNTKCSCHKNKRILLTKSATDPNFYQIALVDSTANSYKTMTRVLFNLSKFEFENWSSTCDFFNILRRGKNQKVIAFSLFGRDEFYYKNLKELSKQIKEAYPDWVMRIYYDQTVDQSIVCDIECSYNRNVDFCDAERLQFKINEPHDLFNASLMHNMMWRFLPINDNFVSSLMFRDSDSFILQVNFFS